MRARAKDERIPPSNPREISIFDFRLSSNAALTPQESGGAPAGGCHSGAELAAAHAQMAVAAAVSQALFEQVLVQPVDTAIDSLLAKALHVYSEKQLQRALTIVDEGGVTLVVAEASRRFLYQVRGRGKGGEAGELYTCLPGHTFCSCGSFFFDTSACQRSGHSVRR